MNQSLKKPRSIVISGSFRKHFKEIQAARNELVRLGFEVLSPLDGTIRDENAEFPVLTTDNTDDPKELERRHLGAIAQAQALYVVNPTGYVGTSSALEMGWAAGLGKPIYTSLPLLETPLKTVVSNVLSPLGLSKFIRPSFELSQSDAEKDRGINEMNDALLKEYELCTADANHLEGVIWTTAGILITGSVAGIGLLGGTLPAEPKTYDIVFRIAVSLLFLCLLWFWRRISKRWYSIQIVMYGRAMEIEQELGLYKERYVQWLKEASRNQPSTLDAKGVEFVKRLLPNYVSTSVRKTVRWLTIVLMIVWVLFLGVQLWQLLPAEPSRDAIPAVRIRPNLSP